MAESRVAFYDPDQVVIYFNGILVKGYADGEFIAVERAADAFQDEVGTDGEVTRSKSNDRRAKVTLKLMQSSLTNAALSAVHLTDLNAPNGAGVGTFRMQDNSGGTIVQGAQCWITKYPDAPMDRTAKPREWVLRIGSVERTEGGN